MEAGVPERKWSIVGGAREDTPAAAEAQRALAELAAIYEHAPIAMMLVDRGLRAVRVNAYAANLAGRTQEEMIGMVGGEAMRCIHHFEDPKGCGFSPSCERCPIRCSVLSTFADKKGREKVEAWLTIVKGEDKDERCLLLSTSYLDGEGLERVLLCAQDITDQKRAELERERLEAQLIQAQKMESVGRLAGGVAHDYNNMLGVIIGHAELGLSGLDAKSPVRDDLEQILKAAERSADITRKLLGFARKQTISPKILDLNDTVTGMLKMLRHLIGEDLEIAWMPGGDLRPVKMDPSQLDQILANLCVNSKDAMDKAGRITIGTENVVLDEAYCSNHAGFVPGEFVMLSVSDDGCGMDRDTLEHIFEPFFTTKEVGKGTGLGLSTVYGIVKQNNGFINVYSEPGKGTTTKIYLQSQSLGNQERKNATAPAIKRGKNEVILLVEDDIGILHITHSMLERLGYRVVAAQSPQEALSLSEQDLTEVQLVMTDVVMPGMDGKELATRLKTRLPHLKTLFMSGYTAEIVVGHGIIGKGVKFISKPFSVAELAAKLRETLDNRN